MTISEGNNLLRLFVLALAVWREARGESHRGKLLVAQTIENRVKDSRWPDNYRSVILQPWQFSAFNKGDPNALEFPKENDPAWAQALDAAEEVMRADPPFTVANHYLTRALFFSGSKPSWADESKVADREGRHVFIRL